MNIDDRSASPHTIYRAIAIGAVGTPLLIAILFVLLPEPSTVPWWERFDVRSWAVFVLVFGALGGLVAAGWTIGCRVTVGVTLGNLVLFFVLPPIAFDASFDVTFLQVWTMLVAIPVAAVFLPVEFALRYAEWSRLRPTRLDGLAVLGGVTHLLAVHVAGAAIHRNPLLPTLGSLLSYEPIGVALLALVVIGLVILGTVPLLAFFRVRLVSPILLLLAAFGWATYRTWLLAIETLPPAGPGFGISPTPLSLYVFGSSVLLLVTIAVGAIEYVVRRKLVIFPPGPLVAPRDR